VLAQPEPAIPLRGGRWFNPAATRHESTTWPVLARKMVELFCPAGGVDPLIGKWLFNESQSNVSIYEGIEDLGNNRFNIIEWPTVDTVVANGTDQPAHYARKLSIKREGENTWHVVWKTKGRGVDHAIWSISDDGQTMTMIGAFHKETGETVEINKVLKRVSRTDRGFAGGWEVVKFTRPVQRYGQTTRRVEIRPYQNTGITLVSLDSGDQAFTKPAI